jgi:hypothetical protein
MSLSYKWVYTQNNINQLIFVMEKCFLWLKSEFLYVIQMSFSFKGS